MDELFEEKLKIVLNLIRTNNTGDEALKITQAVLNMAHAKKLFIEEKQTTKKQGTGAN